MTTYREFAIDYLTGQDDFDTEPETIEKLADALKQHEIPTDGYEDMEEEEVWGIRDKINSIADEVLS